MPRYRNNLPQLNGNFFLTDGGLETSVIFQEGIDLPEFAGFDHLEKEAGRKILKEYCRKYTDIDRAAKAEGMPVVISYTVETDGKLPSGELLKDAIIDIDADR